MERDYAKDGTRTRAGKLARQAAFLESVRKGMSPEEALEFHHLGKNTLIKWRSNGGNPQDRENFRIQYAAALRGAIASNETPGAFPDFLRFRERHFAYIDERTQTVKRAVNNWYQVDANSKLESDKRLIVVLPPGHIKTTFFSIERSVYDIFRNRNIRITAVQKNEKEAAKLISAVQERLSSHDSYHYLRDRLLEQGDHPIECPLCVYEIDKTPFIPARNARTGDKWGAFGFRVLGRTSAEKDDTMQAKGVGSQIQGIRADRIILDDVQDPMMATKSQTDSDDKVDWFHKVILGRVYDYQQVMVLANFFAPQDFAHKLIDQHPDWPAYFYPAVTDQEKKKVLCPEVWTFNALMQKKGEVGDEVWHYTWMQEEGSFESAIFREEALAQAKDEDYILGQVPPQVTHLFMGCDPAISQFCAIVVWGLDVHTGHRFLVDVFNQKGLRTFQNVQAAILERARSYNKASGRVAAIELNNVQGSISNDIDFTREMRRYGWRVTTYQTRTGFGARSEHDEYDISSIGTLFDHGLITLPYGGTVEQRQKVDAYANQFISWRPGVKYLTRDMVMATLFAESECYPVAQRGAEDRPKYNSQRVPEFAKNKFGGFRWQRTKEPA